MFPDFDIRPSDSPLVERVWRSHNDQAGSFTAISTVSWSMVVSKYNGRLALSIHGPVTGATTMDCLTDLEWFGIDFKVGTFMPNILPGSMVDWNIMLPQTARNTFWLGDSVWEFPNFNNADTFVDRLVREGLLTNDPTVSAIQQGHSPKLSLRSVQYRYLLSTGLSQRTIRQIERARYATTLLKQGVSIFDVVYKAGYSDQAHLTRSLKHYIGHTPTEILTTPIIAL